MAPTPYVYKTNPGAKTALAYLDGFHKMLTSGLGSHHWTVQSYTYPNLYISCNDNPNRWVRYFASSTSNIVAYLSLNGGSSYLNATGVSIGNSNSTYAMSRTDYGVSDFEMYMVEVEDAIIMGASGKNATNLTGLLPGALGQSLIAGRIAYTQNKNDETLGITGEGIWGGVPGGYPSNGNFAWLSGVVGTVCFLYWGTRQLVAYANTLASSNNSNNLTKNIKDGTVDRFVPMPLIGGTGTGDPGLAAYSKYLRCRSYSYGNTDPVYGVISNSTYYPTADANVYWRHNISYSTNLSNNVIIWCNPANEVVVP